MLKKLQRLQKNAEIVSVLKKGALYRGRNLRMKALFGKTKATRVAFVVSNKVEKRAVARNTIKRRMREALRKQIPNLKSGYDVVISALPSITKDSYQDIQREVQRGLARLDILK